jgi:hypothetical protein
MNLKKLLGGLVAVSLAGLFGWNAYVESRPIPPDVSCVAATVRHEGRNKKDETRRLIAYTTIEAAREEGIALCPYAREQRVTQRRRNTHHQSLDVRMPELRSWWQVGAHAALKPDLEKEWRAALVIAQEVLQGEWKPGGELVQSIRFRSSAVMTPQNMRAFKSVPLYREAQEFEYIATLEGLDFYRAIKK